jgi:DNA polymerase III delta prime subunit
MLLERWKPKSLSELFNAKPAIQLFAALRAHRSVLLAGPPGTGKSTALRLIADRLDYEIVFLESLEEISDEQSLSHSGKIFVFDADGRSFSGIPERSKWPFVIVTTDLYQQKLNSLRRSLPVIRFHKVNTSLLARWLGHVCETEGIRAEPTALTALAIGSDGDVRAALLALEQLREEGIGKNVKEISRDRSENIYEAVQTILNDPSRSREAAGRIDPNILIWMLRNEISKLNEGERCSAFRILAIAERFHALVRQRQAWSLEGYFYDMIEMMAFHIS